LMSNSLIRQFFPGRRHAFAAGEKIPAEIDDGLAHPTGEMQLEDGRWIRLTHSPSKEGGMVLIDEFRAKELLKALADGNQALSTLHEIAGGSAANTLAGLASLGGNGLYVGKVFDDRLGHVFAKSMSAQGITFTTHPTSTGSTTASCLIAVTPDGQRSMSTYLGACRELTPLYVPPDN